jgi:SAM-dependent methyltransferase
MGEHKYLHSDTKDEIELDRLRLLERIYDPTTICHLEMLGISEGSSCLEVGAGAGSIAQWLSKRVGPIGRVVATDIDTRFLRGMNTPNLEVRWHDITKNELEKGEYDLVHCRYVLEHLPEPEKALKRMADAVRPGGWLLIEDADYGSYLSADVMNASAAFFTTTCRVLFGFLQKKKIADPFFGRQLRELMEQLRFVEVGHDGWTLMYRGGEPDSSIWSATFQAAARPMIADGLLSQEQHDNVVRLFKEPTFNFIGPIMFGAWGRRPAEDI